MITSSVKNLEASVIKAEHKLQHLYGQKETLESQYAENLARFKQIEADERLYLKTSTLLQLVSEKAREMSVERIESIISQALQAVMDNKFLKFKIVFENKRNAVFVDFKIWDDELKQNLDVTKSEAGGIKGIVATILRLLVIDLYSPKISGPIILDEVGVQISVEYQARFGKFLQEYSKMMERQIILISHQDRVREHANKTIRLTRSETESKIDE